MKWRKKGFHHCGGIKYDPQKKTWINFERIYGKLIIENLSKEEVDATLKKIKRINGRIINKTIEERAVKAPYIEWWIKEHSCVSVIQNALGMNKWFIFTPYQLYCALNKS
jgi:hypothetical protein